MINLNNKWFSIIEILIWIFIFTLGLVSIYALIISSLRLNDYSKNSIIASSLAKEGIELVRNIRDGNYNTIHKWNKLPWNDVNNLFLTWVYYKIENDFWFSASFPIKIEVISNFWEWKNEINETTWKMNNYRLCLDSQNRYTYDCSTWNLKSYFYRYIKFDDVEYNSWTLQKIDDALKLTSKVIWYNNWYHEVELKTIITDWQKR